MKIISRKSYCVYLFVIYSTEFVELIHYLEMYFINVLANDSELLINCYLSLMTQLIFCNLSFILLLFIWNLSWFVVCQVAMFCVINMYVT